jgi:hypothetical protein
MPPRSPISLGPYACSREEILAIRRGTITTIVGPANYIAKDGSVRRSGWFRARPGDLIWTQEPTKEFICRGHEEHRDMIYEADFKNGFGSPKIQPMGRRGFKQIMHPSDKMPRYLSRTTLEIVGKSFGNVWDISRDDALLCGIQPVILATYDCFEYAAQKGLWATTHQLAFSKVFEARYGKMALGDNPQYIALSFVVHEKNIGEMLGDATFPTPTPAVVEPEPDPVALIKRMDDAIAMATKPAIVAPEQPKETPVIKSKSEIVPDEAVERVHAHANFGNMSKREVVDEGVLKYAMGYESGHTQLQILLEHGLIKKPRGFNSYKSELTKKGRTYFRAMYRNVPFNDLLKLAS